MSATMTADLSEEQKKGSQEEVAITPPAAATCSAGLTVAGEHTKIDISNEREIDIHERDPNSMNDYVRVGFSLTALQ